MSPRTSEARLLGAAVVLGLLAFAIARANLGASDGATRIQFLFVCLLAVLTRESLARIILEQPILGAKVLMELVLMLSKRLRVTSAKLVGLMDKYEGGGVPGDS